ncbi:hypothetical protein K469DRAFT_147475 [Zopfia rhizophila CBS 207.26]|uniref:Uncharacterized protein n=1 Tax=Zopfia rhizophila CBS 207.26 TaxID=1314779 RepID=A0A6A6E4X2_9PEZI|nr:hypothetical protein K469DRAFT_147475 [Zopfia rhizophila CBS 207.26]
MIPHEVKSLLFYQHCQAHSHSNSPYKSFWRSLLEPIQLTHSPGTAYLNCEVRQFIFTPNSTEQDAHIVETEESKKTRGASRVEDDLHVLEDLDRVEESRL